MEHVIKAQNDWRDVRQPSSCSASQLQLFYFYFLRPVMCFALFLLRRHLFLLMAFSKCN